MNGYSKMKGNGNGKSSRSIDQFWPDHSALPQPPSPISEPAPPNPTPNNQPQHHPTKTAGQHDPLPEQEGNTTSGPKLKRNSSVSSAYALQATVKRAFSMRRSSSVSERYRRIHDQSMIWETATFDGEEEADNTVGTARSAEKRKKHNRGKILKAWKKLFGL
ncbi:hypothetical protein SLEP1_g40765 [Rubroshorea leprosula]|uniref:Uncharacterized protein n=1 Tax=Rubroshorea leprosula TaxID=152421 RepID=A0AAV5L4Y0_9ROSI|nr:hypothetical protein SLEP1_g40765 [Rubroshorea leprosula]